MIVSLILCCVVFTCCVNLRLLRLESHLMHILKAGATKSTSSQRCPFSYSLFFSFYFVTRNPVIAVLSGSRRSSFGCQNLKRMNNPTQTQSSGFFSLWTRLAGALLLYRDSMSKTYTAQAWQTWVFSFFPLFLLFSVTGCVTMFSVVPVGRRRAAWQTNGHFHGKLDLKCSSSDAVTISALTQTGSG